LPENSACVLLAGIVKLAVLPPPSNWTAGSSVGLVKVRIIRPEVATERTGEIVKLTLGCWRESRISDRPLMVMPPPITEKLWPFEAPPPGKGLKTVIVAWPTVSVSLGGIEALSSVPLMKVVGRSEPFQRTADVVTKPVPITVRVKG
jgi:hypothetical protein